MNWKRLLVCTLFFALLLVANSSFAQVDCDMFPLDPDCGDPDDAPIDSGVGLLIGVTALYTVKRIREKFNDVKKD